MGQSPKRRIRSPDRSYPGANWRDKGRTRVVVYLLLAVWTLLIFYGLLRPSAWYAVLPGAGLWALVLGVVLSRPLGYWIADTLLQLPGPERKDRHPPTHRSMTYPYSLDQVEWKPEAVPPSFYSTHSAPVSWKTLVTQLAEVLDRATPAELKIEAHDLTLVVSDHGGHAPIFLAGALQPPPQDPVERAMHGCLEALWRVQALVVRRVGDTWPSRDLPTTPSVRFEDGGMQLWYGLAAAPTLQLDPILFDPEAHEIPGFSGTSFNT